MEEKVEEKVSETYIKLKEFRNVFKKEFFEGKFNYEINPASNDAYLAEFEVHCVGTKIGFCVSKDRGPQNSFICYYSDLIRNCFNQEEIKRLQEIAMDKLPELNEEVARKIEELENEIANLKRGSRVLLKELKRL